VFALLFSALVVSPAAAEDEEPGPDLETSTVLTVRVGGDRTGAGQGDVTGLDGVTLGVYSSDGVLVDTCVSAAGLCTLVVPETDPEGSNYNQRFVIRQIGVPDGWYMNPHLRTGGVNATPANIRAYEFQTPALTAREYTPEQLLSSTGMGPTGTVSETASLGHWQQSRNNPTLTPTCGIGRVAILADWSSSVSINPGYAVLRQTLDQIADAFTGTPGFLSFVPFGYQYLPTDSSYFPTACPNSVASFKELYVDWGSLGSQGTNWDAALRTVMHGDPDLVIMLTDGNPTVWGGGDLGQGGASSNQLADVEAAIFAANTLKANGIRVVALGVGDGVSQASGGEANLRAVSGPTAFDGSNYREADYYQTADYVRAAEVFRQMAIDSCEGTLTVVKRVVRPDGSITAGDSVVAGPGWEFTVSGEVITGGSQTTETDQTGTVKFDLAAGEDLLTDVRVAERQHTGYTLLPVDGTPDGPKAMCTCIGTGTIYTVTNDPDDPNALHVHDIPAYGATTCTVYNRAPEDSTSVQVDKRWVIDGETVADGQQPYGLEAALLLTARPGGAPTNGVAHPIDSARFGEEYHRYSEEDGGYFSAIDGVTIGETVTDGPYCTTDPSRTTIHALASESSGTYTGINPRLRENHQVNLLADPTWNHYVITNYADCTPPLRWTLSKSSDPVSGTTVDPGSRVTYTVTVENLEPESLVGLRDLTIVDDLTDVLGLADLDETSITPSTGDATFSGTTLTWLIDALDSTATLTYAVVLHEDVGYALQIANAVYGLPSGGDPEVPGSEGVPPEQCVEDEPCVTVHHTPRAVIEGVVYDLALRMWVGEVYRDGLLVHSLHPHSDHPGPSHHIPYVGFDDPEYDTLVGDLLVMHIHLFNQGEGIARLEQLAGYIPDSLTLATPADIAQIVPVDGPITNGYWSMGSDGNLYYDPPDPIVIDPGQEARVRMTVEVGPSSAPIPDSRYTEVDMYMEISAFSGLVTLQQAEESGVSPLVAAMAVPAPAQDAVWLAVMDIDSHPDDTNNEVPDGLYKTNVIHESAHSNLGGLRAFTVLAVGLDEDDHDGIHLRVVRQEVLVSDGPTPGSSRGFLASTGITLWLTAAISLVVMTAGWAMVARRRCLRTAEQR